MRKILNAKFKIIVMNDGRIGRAGNVIQLKSSAEVPEGKKIQTISSLNNRYRYYAW